MIVVEIVGGFAVVLDAFYDLLERFTACYCSDQRVGLARVRRNGGCGRKDDDGPSVSIVDHVANESYWWRKVVRKTSLPFFVFELMMNTV
jgi:hypothetical protein